MQKKDVFFGFRSVTASEKPTLVKGVFSSVASHYDRMNDLMSFGMHHLWKEDLVRAVKLPKNATPFKVLDLACGTGDISFQMAQASGDGSEIFGADLSLPMLEEAQKRREHLAEAHKCFFTVADAQSLPFKDKTFDAVTIAFGIRNVTEIETALKEAYRVLKPGGCFLCLEFSPPDDLLIKPFYDFYSFAVIPALGKAVTGDGASYRYLVESIRKFPKPSAFADHMASAGFEDIDWRSFSFGVVCLHKGWRVF